MAKENTNTIINQEVTEVSSETLSIYPWEQKSGLLYESKQAVNKTACQELLGINPKTWYDLERQGVLEGCASYVECIQKILKYYQKRQEVSMEKLRLEQEAKKAKQEAGGKRASYDEDGPILHPIVEAQMIQKIRVDKARERQLHLANKQTQKDFLNKQELLQLITPIFSNIANMLKQSADEAPALAPVVDKCFASLFNLGNKLLKTCDEDEEMFIEELMEANINIEELLENGLSR